MIGLWTKQWAKEQGLFVTYFDSIDSTNSYAKEEAENLSFPSLIISDRQTQGRGRGSRQWLGLTKGHGLYSTWAFKSSQSFSPILTLKIGLALLNALKKHWPDDHFSIKAPNDIYLEKDKLAGILVESLLAKTNYLFIGIGMNILSKPHLDGTTFLDENMNKKKWAHFLDSLWGNIKNINFHKKNIDSEERKLLKSSLQEHYKEAIIDISEYGDIVFANTKIHWHEL